MSQFLYLSYEFGCKYMTNMNCTDCGGVIDLPDDCLVNEIICCPDCGLDYVIIEEESGLLTIKELTLEGEDWGE